MEAKEKLENLAQISNITTNEDNLIEEFMSILDTKIHEAKDMLLERYKLMCSQPASAARFMYENNTMAGYIPEEGIESALKHGTLAIGQIGLAETLQILVKCDHTTKKGMELAKKIEQLFNTRCKEFKNEYKLNFGVYYTPAESLCGTALVKFREKYGVIPNVSDRESILRTPYMSRYGEKLVLLIKLILKVNLRIIAMLVVFYILNCLQE